MAYSEWTTVGKGCCRNCAGSNLICRLWESSDGAHEDYQYRCNDCGYEWWIEGSDY